MRPKKTIGNSVSVALLAKLPVGEILSFWSNEFLFSIMHETVKNTRDVLTVSCEPFLPIFGRPRWQTLPFPLAVKTVIHAVNHSSFIMRRDAVLFAKPLSTLLRPVVYIFAKRLNLPAKFTATGKARSLFSKLLQTHAAFRPVNDSPFRNRLFFIPYCNFKGCVF